MASGVVPPHQQTIDDLVATHGTDARDGLPDEEARHRLARDGANELTADAPVAWWRKFFAQFEDVLVLLLLVATALSAVLWLVERESALPYEAMAILAVVLLNAVMGYVQESRAEAAVAALRDMAAPQAHIIRGGERRRMAAAGLVTGDLILIEEGDVIPADARIVESTALQVAEASLTGESLPVVKTTAPVAGDAALGDRTNMLYSGTAATYGRGRAVVTAIGMRTEVGSIASMLKAAPHETTPLQKELDRVGRLLAIIVVVIAVVIIVTIVLVQQVRDLSALFDVLLLGVALAVAAVPEGLPAIVTTVLALGVRRMAARHAIVRHLAAVETLGSVDVIASDKTGTLTKNEMTVRTVITASGRVTLTGIGYAPSGDVQGESGAAPVDALKGEVKRALTAADRANNAVLLERAAVWSVQGDPTEGALLVAARKAGLDRAVLDARFQRVGEIPFSSERKVMTTIHADAERAEHLRVFSKGAPDVLLAHCTHERVSEEARPLSDARRAEIVQTMDALAGEALRALGMATRELPRDAFAHGVADERFERDLEFLGVVGMSDPPRPEARDAVARARSAGIRAVMITGDHPRTAAVIAGELGIASDARVVTGVELAQMSDDTLAQTVRDVSVYARVDPAHKLRIVQALQKSGATVAMTGDGVNDAPALKTADIGVAMGMAGTDVSKQAADVVLTDDNFATIVAAVQEGRSIFANIRKFLRFLLSSNIGEVMTMFFGVLLARTIGLEAEGTVVVLPLLATQILWINLVTDGAPALALGVDPADEGLMQRAPRPRTEGIITRSMWLGIVFLGTIMAAGTLLVLDASMPGGLIQGAGSLRYGQTMAFTTLMLFQVVNVFNARSDVRSAFSGLFHNRWLWSAVGLSLALQAAVVYLPFLQQAFSTVRLSAADWLRCAAVASSVLWLSELSKIVRRRRGPLVASRDRAA